MRKLLFENLSNSFTTFWHAKQYAKVRLTGNEHNSDNPFKENIIDFAGPFLYLVVIMATSHEGALLYCQSETSFSIQDLNIGADGEYVDLFDFMTKEIHTKKNDPLANAE